MTDESQLDIYGLPCRQFELRVMAHDSVGGDVNATPAQGFVRAMFISSLKPSVK
jgi:hypothetical protein